MAQAQSARASARAVVVVVTDAQDAVRLTVGNPEFAKTMEVFESLNRRYRNTLRELAK